MIPTKMRSWEVVVFRNSKAQLKTNNTVGGHWPGSLTQAWVMTAIIFWVMTRVRSWSKIFYWVVSEMGHDLRLYFEIYSHWRIFELGILKISFRGVISYTIQAIQIIQDFMFVKYFWVMTQIIFWSWSPTLIKNTICANLILFSKNKIF